MSLNIHEVFEPAPLKNFLLVVRSKGNIPCKFCAMATPVVNYFNSRLPREEQITLLYLEDNSDPRVQKVVEHYGNRVPVPILYFKGRKIEGAISVWHYFGMMEALLGTA